MMPESVVVTGCCYFQVHPTYNSYSLLAGFTFVLLIILCSNFRWISNMKCAPSGRHPDIAVTLGDNVGET